jgi:four helix bundle protein
MVTEPYDLKLRTKQYALRIIRLYSALPKSSISQVLGKQLLRSGTSVGAHYREAFRAKSNADFISKMEGGLQELDESAYWLELLVDAGVMESKKTSALIKETEELISIFVTMTKRVKAKTK